ncbi:putative zinc finger protein [Cryptosporidium felis]|nr:putative zinc finger protein [Cryptosporidium felis]
MLDASRSDLDTINDRTETIINEVEGIELSDNLSNIEFTETLENNVSQTQTTPQRRILRDSLELFKEIVRQFIYRLEYTSRNQLPAIKFVLRIFIILTLTILPLINEIHTITPLLSVFLRDNDWFLIPMSMNRNTLNNDLLLRLSRQEFNLLLQKKPRQQANHEVYYNSEFSQGSKGLFLQNSSKKIKNLYFPNNVCINRESRLYFGKENVNFINQQLTLLVPTIWCPSNLSDELNQLIYNTRKEGVYRRLHAINEEKRKVMGLVPLKMHNNGYRYKPTSVFKAISTFFVIIRWFVLISRMVMQVWNFNPILPGPENSNFNNLQLRFIQEFKSLVSFSIFYIWSLSCVYLLFGLTTSKCSAFPKIALHETIQWILWICVSITTICFYVARLPMFDNIEAVHSIDTSDRSSLSGENSQTEDLSYQSRKRRILIQHILSVISCCGFGFSLSGSVLLLSTRITSPWVNSCFITIISQSLDLLLRGYLGLIIDQHAYGERKIRYFKYVFPAYLLKDEEKTNCNANGQREWIVKCTGNSQPPPLIFKHCFISIRLKRISATFFSTSNFYDSQHENFEGSNGTDNNYTDTNNLIQPINCMICYENQSNIVFSPCLHSGICDLCIDELMKWTVCKLKKSPCCHLCRCPIEIAWQLEMKEPSIKDNSFYSRKCIEVIYPKLQPFDDLNEKQSL